MQRLEATLKQACPCAHPAIPSSHFVPEKQFASASSILAAQTLVFGVGVGASVTAIKSGSATTPHSLSGMLKQAVCEGHPSAHLLFVAQFVLASS
jgi:hypothetical protein